MAKVHPLYVVPSLAGVYMPPAMAPFKEGHYTHNGLRGIGQLNTDPKEALPSKTNLPLLVGGSVAALLLLRAFLK